MLPTCKTIPLETNYIPQEDTKSNLEINQSAANSSITSEEKVNSTKSYPLSEIEEHLDVNDCWVGYGGKVYDATDYLSKHPGGKSAITKYCGTVDEFTEALDAKHSPSYINKLPLIGTIE